MFWCLFFGFFILLLLYNIKLFSGMENVAEHINEMQRIHEEYGAIFDHLYRQYQRSTSQLHELNPGDLLYYGGVEWLNISGFLGKIKKGLELHAMCFIFRTAVVFLCKERLRSKRKQLLVSPLKNFLGQCLSLCTDLLRQGLKTQGIIGETKGCKRFFKVEFPNSQQMGLRTDYVCLLY